ncbi:hypothetical protein D3H65_08495 [Paraflavitalea soli]|uniref:Uncharacterized protein n=1 Tax=Paraflavitalea soli TaxID=2315862 RepID=A0A3B7ML67_9BACT|nr:hypothetical protein [Paraflavitalea soli]AXY74019.1 hypothetical protein D3H65_08495 [Paraflavitalea soli]
MARLTSTPSFIGTYGPVTVYFMFGKYYMRSRSSLTGKRVKKDPAFRKTMQYAALLAKASPIALKLYAVVPLPNKKHKVRCKITGEVMTWLRYGWSDTDIIEYLAKKYAPPYGGMQVSEEGPVTVLRPSYRRARPGVRNTVQGLFKNIPAERPSFELLYWRRRDKQFRRVLHKENRNSSTSAPPIFQLDQAILYGSRKN